MHWSYMQTSCAKIRPDKKMKRKYFLLRITHDLVIQFVTQRYKLSTLPRNIKTAIVMWRLVSNSEENTMQDPEDYEAISRKRRHCNVCHRNRDVKTQFVCKGCGHYICKDHMSMIVTCDICKNKDETDESDKFALFFQLFLFFKPFYHIYILEYRNEYWT